MDQKSRPSNFRIKVIPFVFTIAIFPFLLSIPTGSANGSDQSANINPFIKKYISHNATGIGKSKQLVFATNKDRSSALVTIHSLEKKDGAWQLAFPPFAGSIGEKGFAAIDEKREGDGKSPSGISLWGWLSAIILRLGPKCLTDRPQTMTTGWMMSIRKITTSGSRVNPRQRLGKG